MSQITSPILLDTTGQDINVTLQGIQEALLASNTLIDDTITANNRVWSSKKLTEALTVTETDSGSTVICSPIAATPVIIECDVEAPTTLVLTQSSDAKTLERSVVIPAAGHFNWSTGNLELSDGSVASLVGNSIMALNGINTFTINIGSMTVTYRTIGTSSSTEPTWDVIFGGSAAEEV